MNSPRVDSRLAAEIAFGQLEDSVGPCQPVDPRLRGGSQAVNVGARDSQERVPRPFFAPTGRVDLWPAPLSDAAYHGLAGEIVRTIEPHTEADPAAVLVQLLAAFGNVIGRSAYFPVEADEHTANLFVVLVGATSKGRKGTAWGHVVRVLKRIDPGWADSRIVQGLSSGEGLIAAVRDEDGDQTGVADKRCLVHEPEFAATLRVLSRDGNTLSAVIRQSWDTGTLRTLTKNQPIRATGAHISIVGHVTRDELRRYLDVTEAGNGFGNRFLWVAARRSRVLPEGGDLRDEDLAPYLAELSAALEFGKNVRRIERDPEAKALWVEIYGELSEGQGGLYGAVTSRAEAQVVRLSALYAVLDRSPVVRIEHLRAALEVWRYVADTCRYVFGESVGDRLGDRLLAALRAKPEGMTRTEIHDAMGRNYPVAELDQALATLTQGGRAESRSEPTGGRPSERWFSK